MTAVAQWALAASASAQGYPAGEAAARMTTAEGLSVRLVAAEPLVRQPVAIEFDDRGRLWVNQYLQYPNPAGLKRVKVDRYSRTVYDRRPDPPPRGTPGADRVTILDDRDGDGLADSARDFVAGLNLASGLAFGDGGVFVLNPPYLLFYPDRDRDDVPDGNPDVLLGGFGIEDAHSVANSLTWGPDGWLYGLQGSTVTADIRGVRFQQGVWRYHPRSKRFELFSDGGGNMWGLDFDRHGQLLASTNVGGHVMLHTVQGGNYWKQFAKHGPLRNPHAYGFFDHVAHEGVRGGHVSVGGLFYQADALPARYRGMYLAGDLLDHKVTWHRVERRGSTFAARQEGDLLVANDTWFAPTDMTLGPDGSVYVADWHDRRTAHPDPDADWDRSNGRIYAITPREVRPLERVDYTRATTRRLLKALRHPNVWHVRRARRLLAERGDPAAWAILERNLRDPADAVLALESLWVLASAGRFDEPLGLELLENPDEEIRAWTVRLLGDREALGAEAAGRLAALARTEGSDRVRAQLASTAARLGPDAGLAIASALAARDLDGDDPHLPLLIWWAVERHALADPEGVLSGFGSAGAWRSRLTREQILPRLARRYAAEGSAAADTACTRLLASAPASERGRLLDGVDEGLRGRRGAVAPGLLAVVSEWAGSAPGDLRLIRVSARLGDRTAMDRALAIGRDPLAGETRRLAMLGLLAELGPPGGCQALVGLAVSDSSQAIRVAALDTLARCGSAGAAASLIHAYPRQDERWKSRARGVLLGRAEWARTFLDAVRRGEVRAADVPLEEAGKVALLGDPGLDATVRALWGTVRAATPEERLAEVRRLNNDLRAGVGDPARGRALFVKHCATCHKLFGEGGDVGPDLTHANRKDRDFLLVSLVDPGGTVRKEYQSYIAGTQGGRVVTGIMAAQDVRSVTLVDAQGTRVTIARDDLEAFRESPVSLMPEDLCKALNPAELRDLFRYLQGDGPSGTRD
jgi:putative membrane-bound dehydrogenase-like protein